MTDPTSPPPPAPEPPPPAGPQPEHFARHFLLALQFFTRIPVTGRLAAWVGFDPAMQRASLAHWPGAGLAVALLASLAYIVAALALSYSPFAPLAAAVLATAVGVAATGALHEDGLADVVDGLGGSAEPARALEIMKDSRVGTFGVLAMVLTLLAKVALLTALGSLATGAAVAALLAGFSLSRLWPLALAAVLPPAGHPERPSKSRSLAAHITDRTLGVGALWCALPALLAIGVLGLGAVVVGVALSAGVVVLMARWFSRRLRGWTGDCLGAAQQAGELAFYLGAALAFG
ncbi:MAG: adenosylcobinamide-GDP ribazoletransferase [Xylophilus ampelinus]